MSRRFIYIYIYIYIYIAFFVPINNSILVTTNLRSLYTSIPNNKGITATEKGYDFTLPTFLALILTLNNFVFNSEFYLQIRGCAMRNICPLQIFLWLNLNINTFIR